jgi:hypothetical protein
LSPPPPLHPAPPASSGTSSIDAAMAEGLSLVQKLDETADLAARVSKNVRRLDDSQSRVASALQRVRDIKGIKDCVGGLQHAIASLDFEVAVPHLHRFHSIKDAMPSDSTDFLQMERLEGELKGKMPHALDRAAAAGNAAEVLRGLIGRMSPPGGQQCSETSPTGAWPRPSNRRTPPSMARC